MKSRIYVYTIRICHTMVEIVPNVQNQSGKYGPPVYSIPQFGVELLYIQYLGREDWIVEEVLQEAGNVLLNRDQVGSAR